jgi:hypothetical protein
LLPPSQGGKRQLTCGDYMKRLNEYILKPLFISNYEKGQLSRMRKFYELYTTKQRQSPDKQESEDRLSEKH